MKSTLFESKFNEFSKYIYFYRKKFTEKSSKKFVFYLYFKTYCNNFLMSVCVFISDLGAPYNKTVGALCYTTTI